MALVIYDGDCAFCTAWVKRWKARTGDQVRYVPFQQPGVLERFQVPKQDAERSVQMITEKGERISGADAALNVVSRDPKYRWLAVVRRLPPLHFAARLIYRFVADHR